MKSHSGRTAESEVYERKRMGGKGAEGELRSTCTGAGGLRGDGQQSDSQPRKRAREGAGATPATTLCRDDPGHCNRAEVGLGAQHWRLLHSAIRMEPVRMRKRTERLLRYQKEQDTKAFSRARWRGARCGAGGCRKVRAGESAGEGGEVTLSLSGRAFPEGANRARRYSATATKVVFARLTRPNSKGKCK